MCLLLQRTWCGVYWSETHTRDTIRSKYVIVPGYSSYMITNGKRIIQVLSHPWITGTYAIPPPLPRDPLTGRGSLVAISRMSKKKRSGRAKKASRRSLHEDASSPQFKKGSSSSGTFNLRLAERSENAADSNRNQDEACLASSSSAESLVSPRRYIAKSSGTSSASSITSSGPSKGRARSRSIDATNNERERKGQVHPTSVVSPAKASDHPVRRHASSKASLSSASSVLYGQGASCPPLSPRYMMISAFRSSSLHTIGQCGNRSLSSSSTPVITSASVNTSSSPSAVHRSRRVRRTSSPPPCENRRDFSRSKTGTNVRALCLLRINNLITLFQRVRCGNDVAAIYSSAV